MSDIKLGSKLPKGADRNGLDTPELFTQFVREPQTPVMAICLLQTSKITRDVENYDTVPTVTVRAIEVVQGDDLGRLRAMLQRLHADRTGLLELPAAWEKVLASMASPTLPGTEQGR